MRSEPKPTGYSGIRGELGKGYVKVLYPHPVCRVARKRSRCPVPALHDLQKGVRDALILDAISGLDSVLVGGSDARKRLAIHQRHYRASLIKEELVTATGAQLTKAFI